ncbi:MAG TPA: hypothetical protein VGG39_00100 [Polyangiaceae bacterium]
MPVRAHVNNGRLLVDEPTDLPRQERKLAKLRAAIAEGDASPDAEPGVFDRIRAKHGLPAAR